MGKILVVYYSRDGACKKVSESLCSLLRAESIEITDEVKRKGFMGFMRSGFQAAREKIVNTIPKTIDFQGIDLVIFGSPVWASKLATPMFSFLNNAKYLPPKVAYYLCAGGQNVVKAQQMMTSLLKNENIEKLSLCQEDFKLGKDTAKIVEFGKKVAL